LSADVIPSEAPGRIPPSGDRSLPARSGGTLSLP
jgi:hypothetical protein